MPQTMKALQWDRKAGKLSLIEKDIPTEDIKSDYILVKVSHSGVCGTDLHIIKSEFPSGEKLTLGHEFSGTVVKISKDIDTVKVGDKVTIDPNCHCGQCHFCHHGKVNFCRKMSSSSVGVFTEGGFANYCLIHKRHVMKLPESFPLDKAALCEPFACIIRGWENLGNIPDDANVLILGAGIIGLFWASLFHYHGHRDVTVTEIAEGRREIAKSLNLGYQILTPKDLQQKFSSIDPAEEGFDIIVDCTGVPKAAEEAFPLLRYAGKFCLFGCCPKISKITINPADIMMKELTIVGSKINPYTSTKAVSLVRNMSERYLNFDKLGIKLFSLDQYEEAIAMLRAGKISKAMFTFDN